MYGAAGTGGRVEGGKWRTVYVASSALALSASSKTPASIAAEAVDFEEFGRGSGTTFRWCRKIQKTSLVTLLTSLHHSLYGLGTRMSRTKSTGRSTSSFVGSPR
jgi:hypothetical protein